METTSPSRVSLFSNPRRWPFDVMDYDAQLQKLLWHVRLDFNSVFLELRHCHLCDNFLHNSKKSDSTICSMVRLCETIFATSAVSKKSLTQQKYIDDLFIHSLQAAPVGSGLDHVLKIFHHLQHGRNARLLHVALLHPLL